MNGRFPLLELLARLPARVWLQAILGLIGFVVLAVLGFALIAGVAAVIVILILGFKAKAWLRSMFAGRPPSDRNTPRVIDVPYEIVERRDEEKR
jgi:energy-coupling factor transporter transmembrane protein EcfT